MRDPPQQISADHAPPLLPPLMRREVPRPRHEDHFYKTSAAMKAGVLKGWSKTECNCEYLDNYGLGNAMYIKRERRRTINLV